MKTVMKLLVLASAFTVLAYEFELVARTEGFRHPTAIAAATFVGGLLVANVAIVCAASLFRWDPSGRKRWWLLFATTPLATLFLLLSGGWVLLS
jgi:hypothetical protein